ncbi:extracellular solute-binding protein [Actinomadura viridis]|uniref:Multiple sugar transport system substrate-binding protein n=1 Tax=Actinomadura viridis TaxID=58110 RepID=A0A931GNI6_9ACTN|nr:extracellular solute-binding protein [Actinomadura viridis]MBG6093005.1 multiple sugar transport system substrate-binding protein [Actinomadura viridis]
MRRLGGRTGLARAAIGVVVASLALSACGREGGAGGQEKAEDAGTGKISGTVKVWAMGSEGELLGDFAKEFERANPGVRIEVTPMGMDVAHDRLVSSIAGNKTPDVSMIGTTWMGELAKTGALDPAPGNLFDKARFFPGSWDTVQFNNTAYGVPWYVETRAFYYRKDLAEKAGVKPPTTWEETRAFAKAVRDEAGASQGIYQNFRIDNWQEILPLVWQSGGDIMNAGKTEWTLDTPEMVKALTHFQSFYKDGTAPNKIDTGAFPQNFIKGQAAAFYSGPWMIYSTEKDGGPGFSEKFDVAPYPKGSAGGTSLVGGGDLVVFKSTKNRDAAWRFVQWLTDPKTQAKWFTVSKDLPAVQSAWEDPALKADKRVAVFGETLKNAKTPPPLPTWTQVGKAMERETEKLALLKQTPEQAAAAMQKAAEQIGTGS